MNYFCTENASAQTLPALIANIRKNLINFKYTLKVIVAIRALLLSCNVTESRDIDNDPGLATPCSAKSETLSSRESIYCLTLKIKLLNELSPLLKKQGTGL